MASPVPQTSPPDKTAELASKLRSAKPGFRLRHWGAAGGLSALSGYTAWLTANNAAVGVAVGAVVFAFLYYGRQRSKAVEQAAILVARGELAAARATLEKLDGRRVGAPSWQLDSLLGAVIWLMGEPEAAIERIQRAQVTSRGNQRRSNLFTLAMLYAIVGRIDDARAARNKLDNLPATPHLRLLRARMDLCIAFHTDDHSDLPDADQLDELGELALSSQQFGDLLILIAWAYAQRNEPEQVDHWLAEGSPRLMYDLTRYMPKLDNWATTWRPPPPRAVGRLHGP